MYDLNEIESKVDKLLENQAVNTTAIAVLGAHVEHVRSYIDNKRILERTIMAGISVALILAMVANYRLIK